MSRLFRCLLRAGLTVIGIVVLVAGSYCADRGSELQERLDLGNRAFTEGRYQEAIAAYSELIHTHGFSPELLHNLANSYAANGQNGKAVLNYLRGLRIDPTDDDLRADLDLIRKKVGLFNDERSLPERFFSQYDMNQWLTRALWGYILLTLLLVSATRFPLKKWGYSCCLLLTGIITICCAGAYYQQQKWNGGVIIEPDTRLLLSPFKKAKSNGSLIEGTLVYSQKKHEGYFYVLDENGRSGWIPSAGFEPINTSSLTYSRDNAEQ